MKIIQKLKEKFGHKKEPILFTAINDYSATMIPEKFYTIKDGKIKFNKFNEAEAHEFIKLGNHNAILEAIKNSCFLDENIIHGFNQILERGNHEEIMAFLNHPGGIYLCQESSQKLIERGNHEEIMFAIENKIFKQNQYIYGFPEILTRGIHEEIMAFLKNFSVASFDRDESIRLVQRGNHKEIMLAIKNKNFCNYYKVYAVHEIIHRGNHKEIMGILKLIEIDDEIVNMIRQRGNSKEIRYVLSH